MKTLLFLLLIPSLAWAEPLIGVYPGGNPHARVPAADAIRDALEPKAARLSYLGDFVDIEWDVSHIRLSLDAAWETGSVYVLNLMTTTALQPLAYPTDEAEWARSNRYYALAGVIRAWGDACGPECYMLLIPYPEHNGNWVPYGHTPTDFIEAFRKLRYILGQMGALPYVRMVWGPNVSDVPGMAPYYPGTDWTDVVGCSAYQTIALVQACVANVRHVAPGKPILLTQTGACRPNGAWARDLVQYLRTQEDVLGFLWFDYNKECDWTLPAAGWREVGRELDPRVRR